MLQIIQKLRLFCEEHEPTSTVLLETALRTRFSFIIFLIPTLILTAYTSDISYYTLFKCSLGWEWSTCVRFTDLCVLLNEFVVMSEQAAVVALGLLFVSLGFFLYFPSQQKYRQRWSSGKTYKHISDCIPWEWFRST